MSSAARPRGPLPARVYWVRRALVFGTAFLLIFGLARMLGSGSDGDDGNGGQQATAEQAAGEQTSNDAASDGATEQAPTPTKKAKPGKLTRAPLPQPTGPCNPADIEVSPEVDRVAANDKIEIPFRISGVDEACTFQVSAKSLVIRITSGSDLIWSSQECARVPSEDVVVRSQRDTKVIFVWNGRRSDDDCSRTAKWAEPGWYHIEAATFGGEPTSDKFELTGPKPVKVYKTEKPKKSKKEKKKDKKKSKPSSSTSPSGSVEPS